MNEKSINIRIVKRLYEKKFIILFSVILFAVCTALISTLFPSKYVAHGVVYPTNSNAMNDILEKPEFGYEFNADKLIQMFYSDGMKKLIIDNFNLIEYYEIDTSDMEWYGKLEEEYYENIVLERTMYSSVYIEVTMKNPKMAANIVNAMIDNIDSVRSSVIKQNIFLYKEDLSSKITVQKLKVDSILNLIIDLPDTENSNNLSKSSLSVLEEREESGTKLYGDNIVSEALRNKYSLEAEQLFNSYYQELGTYNNLMGDYSLAKIRLSQPIPGIYRVERANPSSQKTNYKWYKIAILGAIVGLISGIGLIALDEKWKELKKIIKS